MEIYKQLAVLGLIRQRRYKANPTTGKVISMCGRAERQIAGLKHEMGYIQHCLDVGYQEKKLMVYEHVFVYLYAYGTYPPGRVIDHINGNKSDNRLVNLRCITQAENNEGNLQKGHEAKMLYIKGKRKPRLTADQIVSIQALAKQPYMSAVQLAKQFGCTRQTIAKYIYPKQPK